MYAGSNKIDLAKDTVYTHPSTKVCSGGDASTLNGKTADQIALSSSYGGLKYTLVEEQTLSKSVVGDEYDTTTAYHTTTFGQFSRYVALQYVLTANYTLTYIQAGASFTIVVGGRDGGSSDGLSFGGSRYAGTYSMQRVIPTYLYNADESSILFSLNVNAGGYVLTAYSYQATRYFYVQARSCQYSVTCKLYGAVPSYFLARSKIGIVKVLAFLGVKNRPKNDRHKTGLADLGKPIFRKIF